MARPLRIEYKGAFYHITARGNERKRIFFSKADYEKFSKGVKFAVDSCINTDSGENCHLFRK
jgi:REP element-mobilizing transposase RayT